LVHLVFAEQVSKRKKKGEKEEEEEEKERSQEREREREKRKKEECLSNVFVQLVLLQNPKTLQ
jgi:H+/gluconate symporter-like permease